MEDSKAVQNRTLGLTTLSATAARSSAATRRLFLLHLLYLFGVFLRQLLRLLLVLLFHLLRSRLTGRLFCQLLMFLVLLLLEFQPILVLLHDQVFLLLLISLVQLRVTRVR